MAAISVVIITRNEAQNITACIRSAQLLSSDIVVVDSGSTDQTVSLAKKAGARVVEMDWKGYGFSRNTGALHAANDWIFSLDADERITPELARKIQQTALCNNRLYQFRRHNFMGHKQIRFGTAGFDKVIRIYNRNFASWDLSIVHEKLQGDCFVKKIAGSMDHFSMEDLQDYREKSVLYAKLSAQKYYSQGIKAGFVKRFLSPAFNSVKSYVFQLGFLDGYKGLQLAKAIAHYTSLKYEFLYQLDQQQSRPQQVRFPIPRKAESKTALSLEK